MFLWVEACNTIVYVQNKSPHRILGGQDSRGGIQKGEAKDRTLEDLWLSSIHPCSRGEEDEVGALRLEGDICWV